MGPGVVNRETRKQAVSHGRGTVASKGACDVVGGAVVVDGHSVEWLGVQFRQCRPGCIVGTSHIL